MDTALSHQSITIRSPSPPTKDNRGRLVWSVDIITGGKAIVRGQQLSDPRDDSQKVECRWYIEDYVANPYSTTRARNAVDLLKTYARHLQRELALTDIVPIPVKGNSGERTIVVIEVQEDWPSNGAQGHETSSGGSSNTIHQLHWELLEDPAIWGQKNVDVQIRRSICDTNNISEDLVKAQLWQNPSHPASSFNILLVVARDTSKEGDIDVDINPTVVSSILTNLQRTFDRSGSSIKVNLEIVRPGTLDALDQHLERSRKLYGDGYFHLVHFDLHGAAKAKVKSDSAAPKSAVLKFNKRNKDGTASDNLIGVRAGRVGETLQKYGITMVVLNACESARANYGENGNIAMIFTKYGVRNIIAMSFKVSDSAAKIFLAAFYQHFITRRLNFSTAASKAREKIRCDSHRSARFNLKIPLLDWFVPVVYCYGPPNQFALKEGCGNILSRMRHNGEDAIADNDVITDLELIGRDFDILRLEKRLLVKKPSEEKSPAVAAVYLFGRPGVGKSAMLQRLHSLWTSTCFVDAALYINFASHRIRNMDDFASELLGQLPASSSPPSDSPTRTIKDQALRRLKNLRVAFILDGLQAIPSPEAAESPDATTISEINDFLRKIAGSQPESATEHSCCFFIFSGRLRKQFTRFDYCSEASSYELCSLKSRFSEDLLQGMMSTAELGAKYSDRQTEVHYTELLVNLFQRIPAALVYFSSLARTSTYTARDLYEKLHSGHIEQPQELGRDNKPSKIFHELESLFTGLPSDTLAALLTLGWYWHEGPSVTSFGETLILSKICKENFDIDGTLELASNWGYIELRHLEDEDSRIINWIHPLFTIYCRIFACALVQSTLAPSTNSWISFSKALVGNIIGHVKSLVFRNPTAGLQVAARLLTSALSANGLQCSTYQYYRFATWFLSDIDSMADRYLPQFSQGRKYTDDQAVKARGKRGLQNFLFASTICLSRGPVTFPVSQWPLASLTFYGMSFRKVSTVAELTVLAEHFERLLKTIAFPGHMALETSELVVALILTSSLAVIHSKFIPSFAQTHKNFIDLGMTIIKVSEARYGRSSDAAMLYFESLLFQSKAEELLLEGREEEASEVWETMISLGQEALGPGTDAAVAALQSRGYSLDAKKLKNNLGDMNNWYTQLGGSWNTMKRHARGELSVEENVSKKMSQFPGVHRKNLDRDYLEDCTFAFYNVDHKFKAIEAAIDPREPGGNGLIAVRHHQDLVKHAIRNHNLEEANTHMNAIQKILERDPSFSEEGLPGLLAEAIDALKKLETIRSSKKAADTE